MHEQAIDLRLALRTALFPSSDFERLLTVLREAEALAVSLDDPRRLGQVSLSLSNHFYFMGTYGQTIALLRPSALARSPRRTERSSTGAWAHQFLGVYLSGPG